MSYLVDLLPGLRTTLLLWVCILAVGLPLGLIFGYLLAYLPRSSRWIATLVVNIARGFPGLVILYFVYAGLPEVQVFLSATLSVIAAFGFTTMGYTAEIFRTAILGVPTQQAEAATALGLGFLKTQRLVILPQALKAVLPALIGFTVIVLQATSLGYSVGLKELTGLSYNLGSVTFHALPYMLATGLIYLVLCLALSQLAAQVSRRGATRRSTTARRASGPPTADRA